MEGLALSHYRKSYNVWFVISSSTKCLTHSKSWCGLFEEVSEEGGWKDLEMQREQEPWDSMPHLNNQICIRERFGSDNTTWAICIIVYLHVFKADRHRHDHHMFHSHPWRKPKLKPVACGHCVFLSVETEKQPLFSAEHGGWLSLLHVEAIRSIIKNLNQDRNRMMHAAITGRGLWIFQLCRVPPLCCFQIVTICWLIYSGRSVISGFRNLLK